MSNKIRRRGGAEHGTTAHRVKAILTKPEPLVTFDELKFVRAHQREVPHGFDLSGWARRVTTPPPHQP